MSTTISINTSKLGRVDDKFPREYRLARRKGELLLQGRYEWVEYGNKVSQDQRGSEWRDLETVEVS